MGVNEVPSQLRRLCRQIVENDGNRAVSGGIDGVRLSCLQGHAKAVFLFCKIADG